MIKLLPYIVAVGAFVGAYFYGYNQGKQGQRIVYQERIIQSGERHAEIEQRQDKWLHVGDTAHIDWLREGSF